MLSCTIFRYYFSLLLGSLSFKEYSTNYNIISSFNPFKEILPPLNDIPSSEFILEINEDAYSSSFPRVPILSFPKN